MGVAFRGQAILLEAAVGFIGDGGFDESGGDGGVEVVVSERRAVGELEALHGVRSGKRAEFFEERDQRGDLVGDLIADLVGLTDLAESGEQGAEEELDKGGRVSGFIAAGENLVVLLLLFADHRFHGKEGEERIPAAEDEGLPKATHPAIAIGEGVNEFKLVMEDATGDERVGIGALEPAEQVFHEAGDEMCRWSEVHDLLSLRDADGTATEFSGIGHKTFQHLAVGGQDIFGGAGRQCGHGFVGVEGVFHFLNLARRSEYPFSRKDGRDLIETERVVLDGKRGMNAADAVFAPEHGHLAGAMKCTETPHVTGDLCDKRENRGGDGVRW